MDLDLENEQQGIENTSAEDTSEVTNNEPVDTDNSNIANNEDSAAEIPPETQGRFSTLEAANKSYAELEKKLGQQSNELGELRKKAILADNLQKKLDEQNLKVANEKGFSSVEEYQNSQEIVNLEADIYSQYINECEYPAEIKRLIEEYRNSHNKEVLELIEGQLSVETLKEIAAQIALGKGELQVKQKEALDKQIYDSAKEYLRINVTKYSDEFQNPAFSELYSEAFKALGCDLDTDRFVTLLRNYGQTLIAARKMNTDIDNENSAATDEIAGISGGKSITNVREKNILEMSVGSRCQVFNSAWEEEE